MRHAAFLGIFLALLFSACSQEESSLKPLKPMEKILAFGDSLTAGTGAAQGEDYPSVLARMINREVINGGVAGEFSDEGLLRLPRWLDEHRPALLILCHGGNDLLARRDHARIADNIRRMIQLAREREIQVVLIGVPAPGLILSAAPFYREIARDFSIPYEGKILIRILSSPSLKADRIHANKEGYRIFARALAKLLHRSGALNTL